MNEYTGKWKSAGYTMVTLHAVLCVKKIILLPSAQANFCIWWLQKFLCQDRDSSWKTVTGLLFQIYKYVND